MYTPPAGSTAKEFVIPSPCSRSERIESSRRRTAPTTPSTLANQIRPRSSGSAEMIASPGGSTSLLTSTSRTTVSDASPPLPPTATTRMCPDVVGTTARSRWSR
jgi:hypothetical protein